MSAISNTSIFTQLHTHHLSSLLHHTSHSLENTQWIIDTKATYHIVYSSTLLTSITSTTHAFIQFPNGSWVEVTYLRTIKLSKSIILIEVLCVPSFTFSLLFVSKLIHNPILCLIFMDKFCFIQDLTTWKTIGRAKIHRGLYYLLTSSPSSNHFKQLLRNFSFSSNSHICNALNMQDFDVWYFRLGHLSSQRMNLIHSHCPDVISLNHTHCTTCFLAKQKRLKFSSSITSTNSIFDLIHSDIWGPYSQTSLHRHHYFLTIVNNYRRTTWMYLMKFKSETKFILQFSFS